MLPVHQLLCVFHQLLCDAQQSDGQWLHLNRCCCRPAPFCHFRPFESLVPPIGCGHWLLFQPRRFRNNVLHPCCFLNEIDRAARKAQLSLLTHCLRTFFCKPEYLPALLLNLLEPGPKPTQIIAKIHRCQDLRLFVHFLSLLG